MAVGGWQHFDLQSELRLTFVYDTAILWQDGIGSPPEAELQGEEPLGAAAADSGCGRQALCVAGQHRDSAALVPLSESE